MFKEIKQNENSKFLFQIYITKTKKILNVKIKSKIFIEILFYSLAVNCCDCKRKNKNVDDGILGMGIHCFLRRILIFFRLNLNILGAWCLAPKRYSHWRTGVVCRCVILLLRWFGLIESLNFDWLMYWRWSFVSSEDDFPLRKELLPSSSKRVYRFCAKWVTKNFLANIRKFF